MTGNYDDQIGVDQVVEEILAGRDPPRPLRVLVSGAKGAMAQNHNIPFFKGVGADILRSDTVYDPTARMDNITQAAKGPDIFNVSVRPIIHTWPVVREVAHLLKPGSLVLISPSIQNPVGEDPNDVIQMLRDRGIDVGFLHFMFGPTVKSWRGQSAMFGIKEPMLNPNWEPLLVNWLIEAKMVVWHGTFETHDHATRFTQVHPMIQAITSLAVWEQSEFPLDKLLELMGPPGWMSAYGQLASGRQPALISEIVTYHPDSPEVLMFVIEFLGRLLQAVLSRDTKRVEALIRKPNLTAEEQRDIQRAWEQHVGVEADIRGGAHWYFLTKAMNQMGRLVQIVSEYDKRGVEKATTGARAIERNGTAIVSVGPTDPDSEGAKEAQRSILDQKLARVLPTRERHGSVDETFYRPTQR